MSKPTLSEFLIKKRNPEVVDVDAVDAGAGGVPAKHARTEQREEAEAPNKFSGEDVLRRVPSSAQGGGVPVHLPTQPPSSFYYVRSAVNVVTTATRSIASALGGGAAARPHQAPPAQPNVAGSSRLVPLEIGDDGDDELAIGGNATALHAADDWLSAPTQKRSDTIDPVIVESNRAWIGTLQVESCRLEFTADRVSLRARRKGGGADIRYSDLLSEGIVTKLLSAYAARDESTWPPDFCGVLALETCDCPSDDIKDFFDPHSPDPQRRALCCLFLDNAEWTDKQRQIIRSKSWSKRWKRLKIEDQDDLMLGRRTVRTAGIKRSARLRARDRRSAAPQLHAPLVYPPEDADSVIVTNADLLRLEVSEFLNDSLVDFALKRLQEELARRLSPVHYERKFHFFNCFFFKKLLSDEVSMRAPGYADEAYARVRKWTARVDLFSKDFIVMPVNQSLHWSLVIICHLSEAERLLDDRRAMDVDADVIDVDHEPADAVGPTPVILHLNSMSGTHANVEDVLRKYLAREWAARRSQPLKRGEALFGKGGPVAFCRASVPQQENYYDCGIFLIEFARRFCLNTPEPYLTMRAANGWPYMLRSTWFPPSEAGESNRDALRAEILSLGECAKPAGQASAPAPGPIVSLVDSDDDGDGDAAGGLPHRPAPAVATATARSTSPMPGEAGEPLTLSDDEA